MPQCFVRRVPALRVVVANAAATLVEPTAAGDGVAVPSTWKMGPLGSAIPQVEFEFRGDPLAASALVGVIVWGYDGTTWWNRGTYGDLAVPAGGGISIIANNVAADQRIDVSATSVSAPVDVNALPIVAEET